MPLSLVAVTLSQLSPDLFVTLSRLCLSPSSPSQRSPYRSSLSHTHLCPDRSLAQVLYLWYYQYQRFRLAVNTFSLFYFWIFFFGYKLWEIFVCGYVICLSRLLFCAWINPMTFALWIPFYHHTNTAMVSIWFRRDLISRLYSTMTDFINRTHLYS